MARRVYLVEEEEEGGGGGGGGGEDGEKRTKKEKRKRNLLREWQRALEGVAAAAARAVPRSYFPVSEDRKEDASLAFSLETLRAAAEALSLARERAGSGAGAAPLALLLSRAAAAAAAEAENEGAGKESSSSFFAEEARFGAWEGDVSVAVEGAERVARAVDALRGLMPR